MFKIPLVATLLVGCLCLTACTSTARPAPIGFVSEVFEIRLNGTHSGLAGATIKTLQDQPKLPSTSSSGLTFTFYSSSTLVESAAKVLHLTATFTVTNTSASTLSVPTYLPVITRGEFATMGATPFFNVLTRKGISTDPAGVQLETAHRLSGTAVISDPQATPMVTNLNTTDLHPILPRNTTLAGILSQGWQAARLPPGTSQRVNFAVAVSLRGRDIGDNDPFRVNLLLIVADRPAGIKALR